MLRIYLVNALLTACDPRPRKIDVAKPRLLQGTAAGRSVNKAKGCTSRNRRKCERAGKRILCERGIEMPSCEHTVVPPAVAETTRLSRPRPESAARDISQHLSTHPV